LICKIRYPGDNYLDRFPLLNNKRNNNTSIKENLKSQFEDAKPYDLKEILDPDNYYAVS
jgi:hypothetical protein